MMKTLLYIFFLFLPLQIFATKYYVKNGGNNLADGKSDENAWATIAKVNTFTFQPGDSVCFKRGSVWREYVRLEVMNGNATGRITYTNYGEGDLPLFINSKEENSESDWINLGANLWRNSDASFVTEVCNIVFNNGESFGLRMKTFAEVISQNQWFYDTANKYITIYSTENPAILYEDIECVLKSSNGKISIPGNSYVTIDGIAIMYEGRHAIAASGSPSNITIRNCYIKYIGGALSSSTVRLGNGIEFYGSANNILIENNYVAHCYDAGITSQYIGTTATTVNNFVVRYNVVSNCNMNLEWFYNNNGTPIGTGDSIIWDNNTLMYAGQEWSYNQRWGTHRGVHLSGSWKDLALTNCYVRNNIFYVSKWAAVRQAYWWLGEVDWDYNIFYGNPAICESSSTYYYTLSDWQSANGGDANSLSTDPLLNPDFTLQSESPAIDAGTNLGYTYDYLGQEVPNGLLPDIGAIERYDEYPPIEPVIVTTIRPYWTSESTAVAGGKVTSTGGGTVSVRGVCWNTTGTPTTSDSKTEDGSGTGAYISLMTGLNNTLTYYVRAYAINEAGTSYGEELLFREGILLIDPATGKPLVKDNKFITR